MRSHPVKTGAESILGEVYGDRAVVKEKVESRKGKQALDLDG